MKKLIAIIVLVSFCIGQAGPAYALRPQGGRSNAIGRLGADIIAGTGKAGAAAGLEQDSSILLDRKSPPPQPVDIASFTVINSKPGKTEDGSLFKIDSDGLEHFETENLESFNEMIFEMGRILIDTQTESEEKIKEMTPHEIMQRFNRFASLRMQNFILEMAIEYNLDMHTEVILQWGSPKLARYHLVPLPKVPGGHRHVLNIDIAAFIDDNLLEAEVLHEILHPRVNPWLRNIHLDLPELIKAVPDAAIDFPDTNPEPGFYAQEAPVDRPEAFKNLAAALAELFVLGREYDYIDKKGATSAVVERLRSQDNPLDKGSRVADMLEKEGFERIEAILDFMSDENDSVYEYPESSENTKRIPKGARLLKGIDPSLLSSILKSLNERLNACLCEPMDVLPKTLDDVAKLIQDKGVQEIELYLDDEKGHLMGQEQSVLLIVNESTLGILRGGISVDRSSLKSSRTGKALAPITDSDGIALPDPATFRILLVNVGGRRRAIISAQVKKPLEVEPAPLEGKYDFGKKYRFIDVERSLSEKEARRKVLTSIRWANRNKSQILRRLGEPATKIENVKVLLSDFSGNTHIIEVPVDKLDAYFEQGIPLTDEQKKYFPTTADKSGLVAKIDPYSLRIVDYADDDEEIEALMLCSITDRDGNPFEGDDRAKLAKTVKRLNEKEMTVYVSAEPEVYFFRKSPDGRLFSSDNAGYYSMIGNLPLDIQAAFSYLIRAMETAGITARYIHPEVGPGQFEVPIEHQDLLKFGDSLVFYKYLVQKAASKSGLVASFLPKPIEGKAGNGQHIHLSAFKGKTNLFWEKGAKHNLSEFAHRFIAGLIEYSYSILPIIGPARTAYERLVPGYEAPCDGAVTDKGRSGEVRVPASNSMASTRVEFRPPNPLGNPYAQLRVVVEAGLRGVEKNLPSRKIYEENLYKMPPAQKIKEGIKQLPGRNDFLGIDAPKALKHAQALMLVDPNHPFVEEVKARMREATYDKLTPEQKDRFKEMYGVDEQNAALVFEGMKDHAIKSFDEAIDTVNNEQAQDRKEFIQSLFTKGELEYLASPEEAETGFMEQNSLLGPAIVSEAAPLPTAAGAAGNAIGNDVVAFKSALVSSQFAKPDITATPAQAWIFLPEITKQTGIGILATQIKGSQDVLLVDTIEEKEKLVSSGVPNITRDNVAALQEYEGKTIDEVVRIIAMKMAQQYGITDVTCLHTPDETFMDMPLVIGSEENPVTIRGITITPAEIRNQLLQILTDMGVTGISAITDADLDAYDKAETLTESI